MLEIKDWGRLPEHILVDIFSYLRRRDRTKAALVCKSWSEVFASPYLWKSFDFWFYEPRQSRYLQCLDYFGKYLRQIYIELDQSVVANRENACEVLKKLAQLPERRLTTLKISFMGENPYFYAGQEFVDALKVLFGPIPNDCKLISNLLDIDLSQLTVSYDDEVIDAISNNNHDLGKLNIQNQVLVCKVSPTSILRLVQKCRKLKDLRVYHCSMSEDILVALTEDDRTPLEHLSIRCRREDKYGKDLDGEVWLGLRRKLPNLRVSLSFDHTCPMYKIADIMKSEVPVYELKLETFSYIYDEVRSAARYYPNTLEKLVIETPMSRNSPELNDALVELATDCKNLRSLHVFCVLYKDTIDKILALHPGLKEKNSYTLKCEPELHPWKAGNDC